VTSFERLFKRLKEVLEAPDLYEVWPDFKPEYDEEEFLQAEIGGFNVLLLHCASCEGPHSLKLGHSTRVMKFADGAFVLG